MLLPHLALWMAAAGSLAAAPPAAVPGPAVAATAVAGPTANVSVRKRVEEVRVGFAVRQGSKLVGDLGKEQLSVLDNGVSPGAITGFQRDSDLPLHLAVIIDHSDSMQKGFAGEQQAARQFLERFLRPNIDSVLLVEFSSQVDISEVASDTAKLSSVESLEASGQTALYDAIVAAGHTLEAQTKSAEPSRRVILLLSDGEDNYSRSDLAEAIEAAQRSDTVVYAITAHNLHYEYQGDTVLRQLADATGGRAFILGTYSHADRAFSEMEAELRTQYSITFRLPSAPACGYHSVRVVLRDPKLRVQARRGYYACSNSSE
jgi:VWFA-related protein